MSGRSWTDLNDVDKRHLVLSSTLARSIRPLLARPPAAQQPVLDLAGVVLRRDVESRQIPPEQVSHLRQVSGLHLAPARGERLRRHGQRFGEASECLTPRHVGETDIDQLRCVERPVIVARDGDRCREDDTGSVDCLEDAVDVAASSDLLNEDGREPLGTELFVNDEEIDLGRIEEAAERAHRAEKKSARAFSS